MMLFKIESLYYLIPAIIIVAIITAVIFFKFKKKERPITIDVEPFIEAFGGLANIEQISAKLSRMRLILHDASLLNQVQLKQLGAHSIIVMSQKVIVLMGDDATSICEQIDGLLKE